MIVSGRLIPSGRQGLAGGALRPHHWPRAAFFAFLLAAIVGLVVFANRNDPGRFLAIDTIQHLSVARNLLEGNGLATSILYYDVQYQFGTIPAPQTVWPAGAALAGAALGGIGVDLATSFVLVSALGVLLAAVALLAALRAAGVRTAIAAPFAALWLVSPTTWHFALRGETEAPFVLFACLALLGAIRAARRDAPRLSDWLLTGTCAALALLWRYQGVYVMAGVGAAALAATWRASWRERIGTVVAALSIPVVLFATIFARNYSLAGELTGVHGDVVDPIPLLTALRYGEWFSERSVARLIGIEPSWVSRTLLVAIVLMSSYAIVAALLRLLRGVRAPGAAPDAAAPVVGVAFAAGFLALALAHMFIGALTTATWYLAGVRYFSVLLPAALFLTACAAEWIARRPAFEARLAASPVPGVLSAAAWIGPAFALAMAIAASREMPPTVGGIEAVLRSREASGLTVEEYLAKNPQLFPMLASWAHELHLVTGRPVVGPQPRSTTATTWDAERTLELCDKLKLRSLLVAPSHLAPPRDHYTSNQRLLQELAQGKEHPRLRLLMQSPEARIYEVLPAAPVAAGVKAGE